MSSERGQGTIEYVAVVLLVAVVMGSAVALLAATGIGQRIIAAFERALCVVTGGPCDDVARPCVRASAQHVDGGRVNVLVARIGHRDIELRERRADGSVAVTLIGERSGGLDAGTGIEAHVRWGTNSWAAGSELRAAVLAEHASGRTWIAPDEAAASRLIDRVRLADRTKRAPASIPATDSYSPYPPLPPQARAPAPDETFSERGGGLTVDLQSGSGTAAVHLGAHEAYGERIERATGRRTVYIRTSASLRGGIASVTRGAASGSGAGAERYGITYDRSGRPLDFEVLSTLDVTGAVSLPPALSQIAGLLRVPLHGDEHIESEQHLDLTDPAGAALVQAYLGGLGAGTSGLRLAAAALRERLDRSGTMAARAYAASFAAHEVGGQARVGGIGLGGEVGSEDSSSRLLAAATRGPGGVWRADTACLPAG
jgi:hypothetical protein